MEYKKIGQTYYVRMDRDDKSTKKNARLTKKSNKNYLLN